jgi:phenylpyruvate tautomerase
MNSVSTGCHPFCDLPGDPSLILTTNVDLGDKKAGILKDLSKLVAKSLGKPESYVGE